MHYRHLLLVTSCLTIAVTSSPAADDDTEIARKLNDPTASLISVPLQSNFDWGGGPNDDGFQYKLNVQPVIPLHLNDDWKIISRVIVPFITQDDIVNDTDQTGLGDMNATFWLASAKQAAGRPIIGVGPIVQLPTATDDILGTEKWCIGPSAVIVHQAHGWTVGALANHLWSVGGKAQREEVSVTFLQPFINYTTPKHTTVGVNMEAGYNWEHEQWTLPVNMSITQLVRIGDTPVSFQLGGRYYADTPNGGPEWGLRFTMTLVFPE